jgi:serine/threonine-protein kinase
VNRPDPTRFAAARLRFEELAEFRPDERSAELGRILEEDPELAAAVAGLLAADDAAGEEFLADGLAGFAPDDLREALSDHGAVSAAVGDRIGPYRLRTLLGRGGMGEVWEADRADGQFEQTVALKLLKLGMDSEAVLRRFLRERQILARLEHPNIARLLDGGLAPDGRPYLVLERVHGEPITTWCRKGGADLATRVRLVIAVAEAVDLAHRNLVVHRDLKPSNLLVDAAGTVKLLDFGIAKILAADDEPTDSTRLEDRALTPAYAAPEQILGLPATTSTDVYSLGVVLYELLTGRLPHVRSTSSRIGLVEEVRRETLTRPSRAVAEVGDQRAARALAGDLDTIAMKALARAPERRYGSIAAFADDLRRYLDGRPVQARPDTFAYRTGKFLRRHAWGAATTAMALVAITLLAAFSTAGLARERDRARLEAAKAQRIAAFLTNLFELADADRTKGIRLSAREVVDRAARNLERDLADEPEVAATMMSLIGDSYAQLGLEDQALPLLEGALVHHRRIHGSEDPRTAAAERRLGGLLLQLQQPGRAEPLLRHALTVEEQRPRAAAEVAATLTLLALLHKATGAYGDADAALDRAAGLQERAGPAFELELAETFISRGHLLLSIDEPSRALPLFQRALALRQRQMGADNPTTAAVLLDVGAAQRELGQLDEAVAAAERVLAIGQRAYGSRHSLPAYALGELAMATGARGEVARACELYRRSIAIFVELSGPDSHPLQVYRRGLGNLLLSSGHPQAGLAELQGVLESSERALGKDHPRVGQALFDVAEAKLALGDDRGVEAAMRRGLAIFRRGLRPDSGQLGHGLAGLGGLLCRGRQRAEGAALLREAVGVLRGTRPAGQVDLVAAQRALRACEPAASASSAAPAPTTRAPG